MNHVEKHLLPNEKVVFQTKLNWTGYLKSVIILLVGFYLLDVSTGLGGFVIFISLVSFVIHYLKIRTSEFAVTNKRILIKVGVLKTISLETMLNKIEGIHVDQGVIGKMVNSGSIIVTGTGGSRAPFPNIDRPFEFRNAVNTQISEFK